MSDGSTVRLDGQVGEVTIGEVGQTIYHQLADLPPGVARFLADAHEASILQIKALERQGDRSSRLEQEFRAYTTGEALERAEQYRALAAEKERERERHAAEQGMLMDGLDAIRTQIADTNAALTTLRADQRRAVRRVALGLAIVALGLIVAVVVALVDRAMAGAALGLAGGALAYYLRTR